MLLINYSVKIVFKKLQKFVLPIHYQHTIIVIDLNTLHKLNSSLEKNIHFTVLLVPSHYLF